MAKTNEIPEYPIFICPECGHEEGDGFELVVRPCEDLRTCVRNLKDRLKRVEDALESHNFL